MIIHLNKFIREEQAYWSELEGLLEKIEKDPGFSFDLEGVNRFHYLYQRASFDLARLMNFSGEQEIRLYLENLVGRAFAEIHEARKKTEHLSLFFWFFKTFPRVFRKQIAAFYFSLAIMMGGCVFGGAAMYFDKDVKDVLMPFPHLQMTPEERVAKEENVKTDHLKGQKSSFSAYLMTHNTKVAIFAMALGMTWGMGTVVILFSNGIMLGAITVDFIHSGQTAFLTGWLLPHGSVEIPAILLAGQAGFVLALSLMGWKTSVPLRRRLRGITFDLVTLIGGAAVLLVWAGIVEAFFSQYHEPVIPYSLKISFGAAQLIILFLFLFKSHPSEKKERGVSHE